MNAMHRRYHMISGRVLLATRELVSMRVSAPYVLRALEQRDDLVGERLPSLHVIRRIAREEEVKR